MNTRHASMHTLERWDDLRVFLAVLRTGSFSAAARELGVEQSTISRRIKALERELNGSLFQRTPEGAHPTLLAERIRQKAEGVEQHITSLLAQTRDTQSEPQGLVRIAITDSMSIHWLLPGLQQRRSELPEGLRWEIVASSESSDLLRGEADIALRFYRPERGELVSKRIAVMEHGLFAHRDYWKKNQHLSWDEQKWLTLYLPQIATPEYHWYHQNFSKPSWLQTNSYSSLLEAIRLGLGLGVVTRSIKKQLPALLELSPPFAMPPPMELWMVTHAELRHSTSIDYTWRLLEEMAQEFVVEDID